MADYSWVKDELGKVCGIWLKDISALDKPGMVEIFLVQSAPYLMNDYMAKKYRVVANNHDSNGGSFIMFGSSRAPGEKSTTDSSSKCFIATAVYGDLNHPSVCILREYRDKTLYKYIFGRIFVRLYYAVSPHLLGFIKHNNWINENAKKILDNIVNKISNK